MSHYRRLALALTLSALFAALALPTLAQGVPATIVAPTPRTLAAALAAAIPPTQGVVLTVDAAKVKLPKDVAVPGVALSITDTASLYGQIARMYGDVTAIAPSTMTVVYAPPETPNPYDGMPPGQVLKLLTSSFDVNQWKTFMGPAGIGLTDLISDTQKQLFMAFFPDGHLKIIKDNPTGPNDPKTRQDISGDALAQLRLKITYSILIGLQMQGKPGGFTVGAGFEPDDAPARYFMTNSQFGNVDHEYGATVREIVPNLAKPSDLRPNSLTDKAQVSLEGVNTIDDLVARLAAATHLELYADVRYGKRHVTLIGPAKTASATGLLQALALCVHGTYRRVGPAYVLTDDLLGAGTKCAQWEDFERKARAMLPDVNSPPTSNPAGYTMRSINWGSDPLAFSPEEQKSYWDKSSMQNESGGSLDVTLPYDQLTAVQQDAAQNFYKQCLSEKEDVDSPSDGPVTLMANIQLVAILPGLGGLVEISGVYSNVLPTAPISAGDSAAVQQAFHIMKPIAPPAREPATFAAVKAAVAEFPHRAVRLSLTAGDDMAPTFAALQKLGFNEIWLNIPVSAAVKNDAPLVSLVVEAVQVGKKDGIAVYPDIRLLDWGEDAPADLLDRDIENRTATETAKNQLFQHRLDYNPVTSFAPGVVQRLVALIADIGGVRGIGGMVWEDRTPLGYKPLNPHVIDGDGNYALGYASAGRLAYLRQYRADPLDVQPNQYGGVRANCHVLGFNDDPDAETALYESWRSLRTSEFQGLLHWLIAALPEPFLVNSPARLPLIVPPVADYSRSMYISWDNLMQPQPSEPIVNSRAVLRAPSKLEYSEVWLGAPKSASAKAWADAAGRSLAAFTATSVQAIVIDARTAPPGALEALTKIGE